MMDSRHRMQLIILGGVLLAFGLPTVWVVLLWQFGGNTLFMGADASGLAWAVFGIPGLLTCIAGVMSILSGARFISPWWAAGFLAPVVLVSGGLSVLPIASGGLPVHMTLFPIAIAACEAFLVYFSRARYLRKRHESDSGAI